MPATYWRPFGTNKEEISSMPPNVKLRANRIIYKVYGARPTRLFFRKGIWTSEFWIPACAGITSKQRRGRGYKRYRMVVQVYLAAFTHCQKSTPKFADSLGGDTRRSYYLHFNIFQPPVVTGGRLLWRFVCVFDPRLPAGAFKTRVRPTRRLLIETPGGFGFFLFGAEFTGYLRGGSDGFFGFFGFGFFEMFANEVLLDEAAKGTGHNVKI